MLRKMYLVSSNKFHNTSEPPPSYQKTKKKSRKLLVKNTRKNKKDHSYDKWVKFRGKIQETNVQREALIKEIAKFLRKVLPTETVQQQVSGDNIYVETPKKAFVEIKDDDGEGDVEEGFKSFGSKHYGEIDIPFLAPTFPIRDCSIHNTESGETAIILGSAILT